MESTTGIVLADRWYPSSKLCSDCGLPNDQLALGERTRICAGFGAHHDRDVNAAVNLQRLATGVLNRLKDKVRTNENGNDRSALVPAHFDEAYKEIVQLIVNDTCKRLQ